MKDNRKRVLFLIPTLSAGGAERVTVTILRHLDRTQFIPTLAVVDTRGAVLLDEVPKDVEFIDLQSSRVRYVLPKLIRLIWRLRPHAVLSTLGQLNVALALVRPLLPNDTRYLARETIIVSEDAKTKKWPRLWDWTHRRFYRRFDALICQGIEMQMDLIHEFALPSEKTVLIHNPVDIARVREMSKLPNGAAKPGGLVSVGRLARQKGIDMLIDALALCGRPDLRVTIVGDGPLRKELEQRAVTKGVAPQVTFTGFQKNPYPFIAQADAFVLSSRYEGFPNVVLESLACGTPVIALPAPGGVRELLRHEPGCTLAEEVTAESLAIAIQSHSFGSRINSAAIERYSAENITRLYEREFLRR